MTAVIAVLLGPMVSEKSTEVLAHLATKIIHWTKMDGTERDKQKVMNEIMENFDFEPCGKNRWLTYKSSYLKN